MGRCDFSGLWHSNASAESEGDSSSVPVKCPTEDEGLPFNPDDIVAKGYEEDSHPKALENGPRTFENKSSGDKLRFDKGEPGKDGHKGRDHYHRYNPERTGKHNEYLDKNERSCRRNCDESHLYPGD